VIDAVEAWQRMVRAFAQAEGHQTSAPKPKPVQKPAKKSAHKPTNAKAPSVAAAIVPDLA
jgi:hypothetical protein